MVLRREIVENFLIISQENKKNQKTNKKYAENEDLECKLLLIIPRRIIQNRLMRDWEERRHMHSRLCGTVDERLR